MAVYVKRGTHWVLENNESVILGTDDDTGLLVTENKSSPYKTYVKTQNGADLLNWYNKTPLFLLNENDEVILKDDDTGILLHYGGNIVNTVAFAVYSDNDNSLTFYYGHIPKVGAEFNGKVVSEVYTGFESTSYMNYFDVPWTSKCSDIKYVYFDVSFYNIQVISTRYWFYQFTNCLVIDLTNLNSSNVTSMYHMFHNCSSLTSLDVANLDTNNVTTMCGMFCGCLNITKLDIKNFDTSKVLNMDNMFEQCSSLTSLTLNINTSKVASMSCMFGQCSNLTSINVSNFDTSSVIDMTYMFDSCSSLVSIDISNFDTSNVKYMYNMFEFCRALQIIYSDDSNFITSSVINGNDMFCFCTSLVGGNGTKYNSSKTDSSMAHIDTEDNPGYFTQK